ncbi:MAG: hypothetical protein AAFR70_14705, partial [Pseudomonadota bacterium]
CEWRSTIVGKRMLIRQETAPIAVFCVAAVLFGMSVGERHGETSLHSNASVVGGNGAPHALRGSLAGRTTREVSPAHFTVVRKDGRHINLLRR